MYSTSIAFVVHLINTSLSNTHSQWYGAPAPLFCKPKQGKNDFTGSWDYGFMCNVGWVDPPIVCDDYEGQKAGTFDHSEPVANRAGRTDVEGCCWWGRGVIQTTGVVRDAVFL